MPLANKSQLEGPKLCPRVTKWKPSVAAVRKEQLKKTKKKKKRTKFTTSDDPAAETKAKLKRKRKSQRIRDMGYCAYCRTYPFGEDTPWTKENYKKHKDACKARKKYKEMSQVAETADVIIPHPKSKRKKVALIQVRKPGDPKTTLI